MAETRSLSTVTIPVTGMTCASCAGRVERALEKVGALLLKDHVEHCVRESIEKGEDADERIEELTAAVERFLRV